VWGNAEIDLRDALIPVDGLDVRVWAYLGDVTVVLAPKRPGPILFSRERSQLVGALKVLGRQLEQVPGVQKVTVYEAIAFGLPSAYVRQGATQIQPARFDIVVLTETDSPDMTPETSGAPLNIRRWSTS
jgi:hypothetical protein